MYSTCIVQFIVSSTCTVGVTEKLPLPFSVHRSLKRRSPFSSQPFSEQMASDMIGYSLSNDWNAVSGTPTIGKFLPSDWNAVGLAALDVNAVSIRLLIG